MTVSVYLIQNNRRLPETSHEYKRYVLAPPTGEYQIELVNRSAQRQLVVLTVDGVNAVDGKNGAYDGAGYVLRPYETATIRGWMRSNSEMAAFEFKPQDKSYANLTGRGTSNVGVVGCAVFNEARRERVPYTTDQYTYRSPFDSGLIGSRGIATDGIDQEVKTSGSLEANRSVGTGYGSRIEQHTGSTSFQRASLRPVEELVLRYGTREQFASWGVGLPIETPPEPRAFPAEPSSGDGFVKPPPGWGR